MDGGYVKLWRKSLDSGLMQNPKLWTFWCWCLLKATHKKRKTMIGMQMIELQPGQFIFGREAAAKELGLSVKTVRTCIDRLKKLENLTIKSTNKFSVISIVNWHNYQQGDQQSDQARGQQGASKQKNAESLDVQGLKADLAENQTFVTAQKTASKTASKNMPQAIDIKGFQDAPSEKTASKTASKGPARGQQGATDKNVKNEKNEKNKETTSCSEPLCVSKQEEAIIKIPLISKNKKTKQPMEYPITETDLSGWAESFPGVEVLLELKKIREWNLSHPTRRKTQRGIRAHITSWLSKAQDNCRASPQGVQPFNRSRRDQSNLNACMEFINES